MAWILGLYDRNALAALQENYEVIIGLDNVKAYIAEWTDDSDEDLIEAIVYVEIDAEDVFEEAFGFMNYTLP